MYSTDQWGGVLTQPRQVLVCRRQHRVPPRLVETLHRGDVSEEALVTPGLQQLVCDHLAQGRGVQNTHLQILQGQYSFIFSAPSGSQEHSYTFGALKHLLIDLHMKDNSLNKLLWSGYKAESDARTEDFGK